MANLHLENFAKIENTDLDIQNITVIAGKPGTGKSYIMKILYTLNEGVNLISEKSTYHQENLDKFKEKTSREGEFDIEKLTKKEREELATILNSFDEMLPYSSDFEKTLNHSYKEILESVFSDIHEISDSFIVETDGIKLSFNENDLNIKISDEEVISEAIFVETPLILEFKSFLKREKLPYHIKSLLDILDKDFSTVDIKNREFIDDFTTKSKAIIEGNIKSSGDSFIFNKTNDKNYDIINASSGIKSIGLLQYLVTNKALKKGSVLFWEEPEVHLHPTWQLKMIELFIELMKNGVKIVFSTHSPYMCDYLNAISKKEKIDEKVSFNLLNEEEGVVSNTILNEENWDLLQEELLAPLEEIMWEYI